MKSFTAAEASKKFGEVLKQASAFPIEITRHGRRSRYVLLSAKLFEEYERIRRAHAEERVLVTAETTIGQVLKVGAEKGRVRVGYEMARLLLERSAK